MTKPKLQHQGALELRGLVVEFVLHCLFQAGCCPFVCPGLLHQRKPGLYALVSLNPFFRLAPGSARSGLLVAS